MRFVSPNMKDLSGLRRGRLMVLAPAKRDADGHIMWRCACDCGGEKLVVSNSLSRINPSLSCGCMNRIAKPRVGAWNEGKSYAINGGEHCYKTRHAWAKAAIRKFGNSCMDCGWNSARCDVHHKEKKSLGGLHTLSNALVLCPNCHRIHHEQEGRQ